MNQKNLLLPVYLNKAAIFDSLAIIDDGFSNITSITSKNDNEKTSNKNIAGDINANFGINNIFSLFSVGLKGNYQNNKRRRKQDIESYEKVHTPTSLLSKFRNYLIEEDILKNISYTNSELNVKSGDYVEFQGNFIKNPLIDTIENIKNLIDLAYIFDPESLNDNKSNSGGGKKKKEPKQKPEIMNQIEAFEKALKIENMIDLIANTEESQMKVVLTCEQSNFLNENINIIADGNYRVLGKVIYAIDNNEEKINLLRMTSISRVQKNAMEQMLSGFYEMEESGIDLPEIMTEVEGPCVQIIPIGIYL
jgi:hypothetical protein